VDPDQPPGDQPPAAPAEPAPAEPAPATQRSGRSPRDMALSLLVLLVPIVLLLIFYRVLLDGDEPVTVDTRPAVADARAAAAFPVAEPVGLPDTWRPTSASFRRVDGGATLRIGYVAPDDEPVLLVESSVPAEQLLRVELGADATTGGPVAVGATTWQRYVSTRDEPAIVLFETGRTVIVVGRAPVERLATLAATLR
jgi:hypothetical protein